MKAMDSLLALSVLATLGTGVANATTVATYDATVTPLDIIFHFPDRCDTIPYDSCPVQFLAHDADILDHVSSHGISGSAVLDDSGTLTITSTYREVTTFGTDATIGNVVTVHGSWDGTTFSAASASQMFTSCVDNVADPNFSTCYGNGGGAHGVPLLLGFPLAAVSGSANASSGSITATWSRPIFYDQHFQYVLSNGTPAVPVPAAAWLFGSGLLGLFGITRRRTAN